MNWSDSNSNEAPDLPANLDDAHPDLAAHLRSRKDAISKGAITDKTYLSGLYMLGGSRAGTDNRLLKSLTGVSEPAIPCHLENENCKKFGDGGLSSRLKGYTLRITFNKLLFAPTIRVECSFNSKTDRSSPPYHAVVVEFHFKDYKDAGTGMRDFKVTRDAITFQTYGATCSGFNQLKQFEARFGDEERELVSYLYSIMDSEFPKEIKIGLYRGAVSYSDLAHFEQIRKRLPGAIQVLPSFSHPEYAAWKLEMDIKAARPSSIKHLLTGPTKDPRVPLQCANTFSTVEEAATQLRHSAHTMAVESHVALQFWARPKHQSKLYDCGDYCVLAVTFSDKVRRLNSTQEDRQIKLPKELECKCNFRGPKSNKTYSRVTATLLSSTPPGLQHHDAFFRLSIEKKKWKADASQATDRDPASFDVDFNPHYNRFTFTQQMETVWELERPRNKRWHEILLNQRHDRVKEVDLTAESGASPERKMRADKWLRECKQWNPEQLQAIDSLTKAKGGMPIIMGPAGIGKTILHEAMSLYFWYLGFHVLSLAPANSNVDHVAREMNVEDLAKKFPGLDFGNFWRLRLYPGSREIKAEKMSEEQADVKEVGHQDGRVLPLNEFVIAISEHEKVKGTAREYSVIHTLIEWADSRRASLSMGSRGANAWDYIRKALKKYRDSEEEERRERRERSEARDAEVDERRKGKLKTLLQELEHDDESKRAIRLCLGQLINLNRFMITTTTSAHAGELRDWWYKPDGAPRVGIVVFIDESAKDLEVNCWGALVCTEWASSVKGAVLFGDDKQLRPTNTSIKERKIQYNSFADRLDISLPGRLIREGFPYTRLKEQRRMHRILSAFPNTHVYDGELRDGPGTDRKLDEYKPGFGKTLTEIIADNKSFSSTQRKEFITRASDNDARLHWIEVTGDIFTSSGGSRVVNANIHVFFEKIWPKLLKYFQDRKERLNDHVMIICAYGLAVLRYNNKIQEKLKASQTQTNPRARLTEADMPKVLTVDASQGQESCMVMFDGSFQRGDMIGFVADPARVNVATTRAKQVFWVIGGDMQFKWRDSPVHLITKYKREMDRDGRVHKFN